MDYGILIFLNLVFLGFFYFLFSIRLGKALDKTKKQGVPREFYENVEMVVRYLDTTLESITQKNEAFYRVVSRADELKKELEALLLEYEKSSKRRKRPPASETQHSQPPPEASGLPKSTAAMRPTNDAGADPTVDRMLRDVGEDRVEWSGASNPSDLAGLIGAKKDRSVRHSPEGRSAGAEGVFSGVGRFARRILGLPELPSLPASLPHEQKEPSSKESERERQASQTPGPTAEQRLSFEEQLMGYAPKTPYPQRSIPVPPPLPEGIVEEPQRENARDYEEPYEKKGSVSEGKKPQSSSLSDVNVPDLSNVKERATFVRTLLQRKIPVEEIAALTGIAVGEIEFIRKVMENQGSRINRGRGR